MVGSAMERPVQISFLLLILVLVITATLNLSTCLLTALFGHLALQLFGRCRSKLLAILMYMVAVIAIVAGLLYFASRAYHTLPQVADQAIPAMVGYAEENGIELPFTDYVSLKSAALSEAREGIATIGRYARFASFQFLMVVAGLVIALSIFLNPSWTSRTVQSNDTGNTYSAATLALGRRFRNLYRSFALVISAQIIISGINTVLTAAFLLIGRYPYALLLICLVFLCGLMPIIGNLISNSVIVGVAFTLSPKAGIFALIFLILIHKLEYFLNSRIVGRHIDSPVWLTLIALLIGERIMGLPGMILAPVFLHYIKVEASAHSFPWNYPASASSPTSP
jgi:predicted PurR-regulated permease PerM